jgi:hypothetical protein
MRPRPKNKAISKKDPGRVKAVGLAEEAKITVAACFMM